MDIRFDGKIALVTGAGKGIGRGIAKALATGGATVHAISRTEKDLEDLQKEVSGIEAHVLDISDWDKTRTLLENIGPVDLLVNNAATGEPCPFLEVSKENIERTFAVNIQAAFNISQVVATSMVERGTGGQIVNISSPSSIKPEPNITPYIMTKAALNMMTKCMALELGQHKIRVNAVAPGLTLTKLVMPLVIAYPEWKVAYMERMPLNKVVDISDTVNAVLFLLSDKSEMITGTVLPVDGGILVN